MMAIDRELTMKIKVDTSDLKTAQKEIKNTSDVFEREVNRIKKSRAFKDLAAGAGNEYRSEVADMAARAVARRQQQRDIANAASQIDPSFARSGRRGGGFGIRGLGALASVTALSAVGRGTADQMGKYAADPQNYSVGQGITDVIKGLPGVGGIVSGMESISPSTLARMSASGAIGRMQGRASDQAQIDAIRSGGVGSLDALYSQSAIAGGQALGARNFANAVAGGAGQFITEDIAGVSSSAQGSAAMALAQARANLAGSGSALEESQLARDRQQLARNAAVGAADAAQSRANIAIGRTNDMAGNETESIWENYGGRTGAKTANEAKQAAEAITDAERKRTEVMKEETRLQERIKEVGAAQKADAQARYELGKAEVGVLQAKLEVIRQQEAIQKSGARQIGGMDDDKKQELLNAFRTLRDKGVKGLDADQTELLAGYAGTSDVLNKKLEEAGAADPVTAQLNAIRGDLGFSGKGLAEAKAEAQKLQEDIIKQNAELNAQFKEALASTISDQIKELGKAVQEAITNGIAAARASIEGKKFVEAHTEKQ